MINPLCELCYETMKTLHVLLNNRDREFGQNNKGEIDTYFTINDFLCYVSVFSLNEKLGDENKDHFFQDDRPICELSQKDLVEYIMSLVPDVTNKEGGGNGNGQMLT